MAESVCYFDNAATTWPKPPQVIAAMSRFLEEDSANPGRAGHRMAVASERMLEGVRRQLTHFINGKEPQRLIFTLNATDALNIAFKGLLRTGDHVITTTLEHNSISRPLQALADAGEITLTRVDFSPQSGQIDPADIARAITPRTRLIALTHASNVVGTIQPAAEIGRLAAEKDIYFLLDVAQTIGLLPIDIQALGVDLLAFPGHKSLMGPTGTGGLYVHDTVALEDLRPFREGGTGGDSSTPTQPRLFPYFLEGGTPNTVGIAGLGAGLEWVKQHDMVGALARERQMLETILETLGDHPRVTFHGPRSAANRVGTLSMSLEGYSPQEVGAILDDSFGIAIRPGLHCAPYAHQTLGTFPDGAVRISPGVFNTSDDLDRLLDALKQLL